MTNLQNVAGGCHCGQVRFDVKMDLTQPMIACNCSICGKTGGMLGFVPATQFNLLSGRERLTDYQFGKKTIHHLFCSTCGVRPFGQGKGPDGQEMYAINVRCLDGVDVSTLKVVPFDGKSR
ncbi:GFA family protein [Myxococcaceae bacterium JPH2]|nr:GFA family protein [Myxococcaceae bacterium JPH2]